MIVLDSSALVTWLLDLPGSARVATAIGDVEQSLHAPHLMTIEVAHVLRRYDATGQIPSTRAAAALSDLADLDVYYHSHEPLLPMIWDLRANLTAYDAAYVALALALDAPLLTCDARVAASPGHRARIELVDAR